MEKEQINMLVANNIKNLMDRRGLDAAKLARMSELNPTGIYDILSGKSRSPKVETLGKIARGLSVPIASLFIDYSDYEIEQELLFVFGQLESGERERLLKTGRAWLPDEKET